MPNLLKSWSLLKPLKIERLVSLLVILICVPIVQEVDAKGSEGDSTGEKVDYLRDIQPIFREHCYECHTGTNAEGGLNLGIRSSVHRSSDEKNVIVPGKSHESLLIELVTTQDKSLMMPPEGKKRLSKRQIELLASWIEQGATWPDGVDVIDPKMDLARSHWAFQRLTSISVPQRSPMDDWSKGPIDLFIAKGHQEKGLSPAKPSDAKSLVRRLYFDLIGLPPSVEQSNRFVQAYLLDADTAVRSLVDELLNSPHYGERWGRHWLDVARYADSAGQEADQDRPHAYRYRDFVIQAFNENMPYNQFVRWQVAGDEYEPSSDTAVSATGFLTAGTSFKLPEQYIESERLLNRYNELDDVISTLGSAFLGITVACARCHDHKYDAFSAKEYYQLLGVFHSGDRVEHKLPSGEPGFFFKDFDKDRRVTWLFRRSDFYDREIEVEIGFPAMLSAGVEATEYWQRTKESLKDGQPINSTLQRRALAEWLTDEQHGAGPLLARVLVNRVWHHHFGHGIVRTTSDFGVQGAKPSNQDLLDHLASEFVQNGWDIKALHRSILNSAVWRQASTRDAVDRRGQQIDPDNSLLWRMLPRRLEAEVLRDSMLAVSQTLNLEAGGPGFKPYIAPEANQARNIQGERYPKDAKDDAKTRRRSVYMFHKRLIPYPLFQAFDRPDLMTTCDRRQNTTVAPQAMAILNDRFVRTVARDFADSLVKRQLGSEQREANYETLNLEQLVESAFEESFTRTPSQAEITHSVDFIQAQITARQSRGEPNFLIDAIADFCQAIFGSNEFIYVD